MCADITKCGNDNCPLRMRCYRYTAIPDMYWQSFAHFEPDQSGKCGDFWDNTGRANFYEKRG